MAIDLETRAYMQDEETNVPSKVAENEQMEGEGVFIDMKTRTCFRAIVWKHVVGCMFSRRGA